MRKLFTSIFFLCAVHGYGQQALQFSQYLFNGVVINPAYAGSREAININGLFRKQWVKVNGEPTSVTFSGDMPVYYDRIGIGAYFIHDELGAQFQNSFFGSFAYRIKVSTRGRLALGIATGVTGYGIDGNKLTTDQPYDPAVPVGRETRTRPAFQGGLYFNTDRFFIGLSLNNMVVNLKNDNDFDLVPYQRKHLFLATGFVSQIADKVKIRPSLMLKEDLRGPTNGDFSAFFIFNDIVWIGASYRSRIYNKSTVEDAGTAKDAVVLMAEIFPIPNLRLGYSYDITITSYRDFATHEISAGYNINRKSGSKMLTPRYF
jgi:type IX secretion system PorP/SprF family membrane protein